MGARERESVHYMSITDTDKVTTSCPSLRSASTVSASTRRHAGVGGMIPGYSETSASASHLHLLKKWTYRHPR